MNEELIQYYVNLLVLQYQAKPKARATIEAFIRAIMFFDLIQEVNDAYALETSIGAQQDVLGLYLGVDRLVTGVLFSRRFFGFARYGEDPDLLPIHGFLRYGDEADAQFLRYGAGRISTLTLNDEEFRTVLRQKAIQNVSAHSVGEIDQLLFDFFDNRVLMDDNMDMTMTYTYPLADQRLASILNAEDLLPRPAGVSVSVSFQ